MANNQQRQNADYFVYSAEFLPLNASTTETKRVQISADADFLVTQITGDVRVDENTEAVIAEPAITLLLKTSGQRDLADRAVRFSSLCGNAKEPYLLPAPKLLPANSVLEVVATQGAVAPRVVRINFHGYKLFK